jgi:vacuolar protein sorting-associated protein 54
MTQVLKKRTNKQLIMKSPLGSIVEAGNTADGDANANMMTSRSAGSDLSDNISNQHNNNESSEANSQADTRKRALDEARMVLTALNAAPQKESKQEIEAVKPPHPPPEDTPDLSKATPKTRSDAVAAAKRRAEERRKSSATSISKHGSPNKPTAATTTTTTNETILSNTNETNSMDWFNLLGPVANPSGIDLPRDLYNYSSSAHTSSHSSHRRPSRHGSGHNNSISNDHIGSSPTESYATSLLNAAGMQDLASYASYAESTTSVAMESMTKNLDDITGWFDHYSRKYLGTLPGIDGALDNEADGNDGGLVSNLRRGRDQVIWEEYEPEFGPEDVPELQREELPMEIEELDLGSVEEYLRRCGMLGMRFEDRGGGFRVMRERMERRRRGESVDEECYVAASSATNLRGEETIIDVPKAIEVVPDLFFSQYFDLTDPICFEKLLVVSDEEVAEIRAKEAELHALAEQKVKEAEEVAKRDAENGVVAPRPPPRHHHNTDGTDDGMSQLTNLPNQSGASLTKDAHRTKTPVDGNVITLRKPETFTAHLDAIELALLEQVRSKSSSFFRETNRFSELQHLVTASVDEVRSLRTDLQSLRERCVTNVELVPIMDDSRKDLRQISRVLEAAEDVVNCKASIASLMSAGDHLGAVEAIGLARSLLAATPDGGIEDAAENDANAANGENDSCHLPQHKLCLGKLKALSKVGEQLNEYQKLVVRNLTDELVDTFLSWGTSQSTAGDDAGSGSVDYRAPPRVALSFDRRSKIRGVVQSLRICGQLPGAGVAYQKRLCELISVTVKAIVTECVADAKATARNGNAEPGAQPRGTMAGVASMSLEQFIDCINMLFEQVLGLLWGAVAVNKFCIEEGLVFDHKINNSGTKTSDSGSENGHSNDNAQHTPSATAAALAAAVDLAEKSVSELLRLRREAHSLVSFDGMRQLWDTSLTFTLQLERFSGRKAYGLRSTLLAQAKSFVERKHEANMSTLAAAMDSERWVQCNVSVHHVLPMRQDCKLTCYSTLHRFLLKGKQPLIVCVQEEPPSHQEMPINAIPTV